MKFFLTVFLAAILVGCASGPPQLSSSRIPVEKSPLLVSRDVPYSYVGVLNDETATEIRHDGHTISIGKFYFSAAGNECRQLRLQSTVSVNENINVVCRKNSSNDWFITRPILANDELVWILGSN